MNTRNKGLLIEGYYDRYSNLAKAFIGDTENVKDLENCVEVLKETKDHNATIYLIGNGGSSAVAEHMAIDLTKNAGLKSMAISGTPMLTTLSNDFGYENVFKKAIEIFSNKGDVLIAISSSGTSKNILNACSTAKEKGLFVITLSGFEEDNPLRTIGDINLYVKTKAFGFLEVLHGFILHYINDSIIGDEVYMIR